MSKVVEISAKLSGDFLGITHDLWEMTAGALWDSLTDNDEDNATLGKGLQKGIDQPRRITFGRDRVGGVIAHQADLERDGKKFIQLIVLINGAPIDAIEQVFIADKPITDYPSESWFYSLSDGRHTTANADAVSKMASWTTSHIGQRQAHVFLELENNREIFPDGIGDTEFQIRGARVWDPRDQAQNPDDENTWQWSQNAVLNTLHYVRFFGAHPVPYDRLPLTWWIAAINVADEDAAFTDKNGQTTTEKRYTVNGSFQFTSNPLSVLSQLERCFAGKVFRQMGQWYVRVGAWYGDPTYTINQNDVHGNIKLKWHAELRERANIVRATYTDPNQNYERTDAPPVVSDAYQVSDNQPLEKSINLSLIHSSTTAQRLALITMEQSRLGSIEIPLKHRGLAAAVGRTVYVNLPKEFINNKIYRVTQRRFRIDGGVTLIAVEDSPLLWADGLVPGEQDLTPNSDYPTGAPSPVNNIDVQIDSDGNAVLSWNHPAPQAVEYYDIDLVRDNVVEHKTAVTFTSFTIPDLKFGSHTATIHARNIFGARSDAATIVFEVTTPPRPVISIDLISHDSAALSATIAGVGNTTTFEWQFLGSDTHPIAGNLIKTYAYTLTGLQPETRYNLKCRTVNLAGVSGWKSVSLTTRNAQAVFDEYGIVIEKNQLAQPTQDLINQMDRNKIGSIAERVYQIDNEVAAQELERQSLAKAVFDVTAAYGSWRNEYERRTLSGERLIDAAVYMDPETGVIVNRAFAYADNAFSEAGLLIDGVNARIDIEANRVSQTETGLTNAEARLTVEAAKIEQRATYSEVNSAISGAIAALTPAYSWQFNSSNEGFTGQSSHNAAGYIVVVNGTPLVSPVISLDAGNNPMIRVRVRKHVAGAWSGLISYSGGTITLPEPSIENAWEVIQIDATGTTGYAGTVVKLSLDLGDCDIDYIEIGKRGANDQALTDVALRATSLEQDIDAATGRMSQYATMTWITAKGYQTQSNVSAEIDSFNTTYSITATLQEFSDNDTLAKANSAAQWVDGANAAIRDQVVAYNATEGGIDSKLTVAADEIDALKGEAKTAITSINSLEVAAKNAGLESVLAEYNRFVIDNDLSLTGVKLAHAEQKIAAQATELESSAELVLTLVTRADNAAADIHVINKAISNERQATVARESKLRTEIGAGDSKAIATANEYTRASIGYCVDSEGNITDEVDAVACVSLPGHSWTDGPLSEFIRNLRISKGENSASLNDIRQVFETVDGNLIARGGMITDVNGKLVGYSTHNNGTTGNLDIMADHHRVGVMIDGVYTPLFYLDNSNPQNPVLVFKGRAEFGGYSVASEEDIRALDGPPGVPGVPGAPGANGVRGAGRFEIGTGTGVWSNSTANNTVGGTPVKGDIVTIYKASYPALQTTRKYSGSSWSSIALHVHGSAIIDGSLDAKAIVAHSKMRSPKIEFIGDTHMRISAAQGFGSSNQFIEWFGPLIISDNEVSYSALTEGNAITYLKTDGTAYFGGAIISGTLNTSLTTSSLSSSAVVEIGPFGSNGDAIAINCSVILSSIHGSLGPQQSTPPKPTCSIVLEEFISNSWIARQSASYTGTSSMRSSPEGGSDYANSGRQSLTGSFTYTDNKNTTANRRYRLRMTARGGLYTQGSWEPSQRISINSQEN